MFTDDEDENVTVIASAFPSMAPLSRTVSSVRVTASLDRLDGLSGSQNSSHPKQFTVIHRSRREHPRNLW